MNVTEVKVTEPIPEFFQEAGRRGLAAARRALQASSNSAGNGEKGDLMATPPLTDGFWRIPDSNKPVFGGDARRYKLSGSSTRPDITVSVICHPYSYGGSKGLWELAYWEEPGGEIGDVHGWLTPTQVEALIDQIEKHGRIVNK
ncbi:MAG: hypothetical protein KA758_01410 [Acidimicrobiales bacterium]|nr:hypothetical protein [Acidimicrobiales bacterium]